MISTTRLRKQTMKHTEAASETHQQEHRIEFHRSRPSKERRVAERCAWARVRFAAPLPIVRRSAPNQDCDGRLRRELNSLALSNYSKGRAFSPLWFRTLWLTSAAFSWKRRNKVTAACPVLRSKPFAEEGRIRCRRTPMRECETRRRAGVYGVEFRGPRSEHSPPSCAVSMNRNYRTSIVFDIPEDDAIVNSKLPRPSTVPTSRCAALGRASRALVK